MRLRRTACLVLGAVGTTIVMSRAQVAPQTRDAGFATFLNRFEQGKLIHRHADPILETTPASALKP